MKYDLLILENDPTGRKLAIEAARLNLRVAIVHIEENSNAISPSWYSLRKMSVDAQQTWDGLIHDARKAELDEQEEFVQSADRFFVDRYFGEPKFIDANTIEIKTNSPEASKDHDWNELISGDIRIEAERIVIATGSTAKKVAHIPTNGKSILTRDDLGSLDSLPKSVVLVNDHRDDSILRFLESRNVSVTQIPDLDDILQVKDRGEQGVEIELIGGTRIVSESFLLDIGRIGNTSNLNLEAADITLDDCNQLWCNDDLSTWTPNIYGLSEVIGCSGILETEKSRADHERILESIYTGCFIEALS